MSLEDFNGDWQVIDSENMDAYYSEYGLSWPLRKLAASITMNYHFKLDDGDKMTVQVTTSMSKEPEVKFHVNGAETEIEADKKKYRATATWKDGKFIVQLSSLKAGVKAMKVTREIINGELHQIMEIGKAVGKQRLRLVKN